MDGRWRWEASLPHGLLLVGINGPTVPSHIAEDGLFVDDWPDADHPTQAHGATWRPVGGCGLVWGYSTRGDTVFRRSDFLVATPVSLNREALDRHLDRLRDIHRSGDRITAIAWESSDMTQRAVMPNVSLEDDLGTSIVYRCDPDRARDRHAFSLYQCGHTPPDLNSYWRQFRWPES